MSQSTIYSIGHGNKSIKKFVEELEAFGIEYLFDVRSKPYSKFHPHYNQALLEIELLEKNITYVFLGKQLGGLPDDISCYVKGKVDYEKLKEKDYFKEGIQLIIDANAENLPIALMCSETKPETCHRSKLIGQELLKSNISIKHIVSTNNIKEQIVVMNELTKGKNLSDLFGEQDLTSRKKY